MDEIIQIKVSQLPFAESLENLSILGIDLVTNQSVQALMSLLKGLDGKNVQLQKTSTHIQWRIEGGSWANLVALTDLKGDTGANIELQKTATHVQWRVTGGSWANLIPLADLKGVKGDPFTYSDFTPEQINGLKVKGDPGESIELNISATHVQWRVVGASTWINLIAISELKGLKGDDAKEVEFQKTATHVQWRRVGGTWADLIPLADLKGNKGDDGKEVQLQKTATHLQWRLAGGSWANIVALADLKGDTGAVPIISIGTVQTVAPGGQSSAEFVTDGLDPNGVQKYKLNLVLVQGATGSVGSIETVTVAFTQASTRANINTGETFSTLFGKIKKWFADLGTLAFKSSVAKTDLESSVQTSLEKADLALQSETDPTVPSWAKSANKPTYTATEVGALPSSHNTDSSAHSDIRSEVAAVRLVAEGALVGYAFDTVSAMNTWIAIPANKAKLKVGHSLFIRALDVPDYWWDGTQALILESEKVDLTGYLLSSVAASTYVAKETGKSLMTDAERTKLSGISTGAQKNSDIAKAEIEAKLTGGITSHYHEASAFTANVLPLDNIAGSYRTATASNVATYTLGTTKIPGAWGKVLVNRTAAPTITGATLILGSEFEASTNMYMVYGYDGNRTEYYFSKITE